MSHRIKVFAALTATMLFWAFSFVWTKVAFTVWTPISTIWLRLVLSSLFIFGYLALTKRLEPLRKKDLKWLMALSFFQPFLYFMGESNGLNYLSSTMGSVIVSTIPLLAPIPGVLFMNERFSWLNLLGIVISFSGVGLILFENGFELKAPIEGLLFMALAVFAALAYSVVIKRMGNRYSPVNLTAWQNLFGVGFFFPFFYLNDWEHFVSTPPTTDALGSLLLLAIFASSFAFIFFAYGIARIGVTRANVFANMIPVFTAIFAWMVLDEALTLKKFAGIAIVIGGLFISQLRKQRDKV
ncbi:DMT family transporter [Marinilabilia salmonicolor]|uniref:Drug/metabolite transporter (DMT)-like permease n=1 Tax=Marinilabilia salmonicolor TaxID=989 RepID=A0A368VDA2_9BACT|nr:DMT family transporter [Marinilabilia salmonicolor]RCW39267.1 drug/metabolite transporter (DMT)-like permease [Marinilabilia salmonicolor]